MLICIRAPKVDDVNLVINQNKIKLCSYPFIPTDARKAADRAHGDGAKMLPVTEGRDGPSCSGHWPSQATTAGDSYTAQEQALFLTLISTP